MYMVETTRQIIKPSWPLETISRNLSSSSGNRLHRTRKRTWNHRGHPSGQQYVNEDTGIKKCIIHILFLLYEFYCNPFRVSSEKENKLFKKKKEWIKISVEHKRSKSMLKTKARHFQKIDWNQCRTQKLDTLKKINWNQCRIQKIVTFKKSSTLCSL
jgi:hypothetical protein